MVETRKLVETGTPETLQNNIPDTLTKESLVNYLTGGIVILATPRQIDDKHGREHGRDGQIAETYYTDGTWLWSAETITYVKRYNTTLPTDFLQHVLATGTYPKKPTTTQWQNMCQTLADTVQITA